MNRLNYLFAILTAIIGLLLVKTNQDMQMAKESLKYDIYTLNSQMLDLKAELNNQDVLYCEIFTSHGFYKDEYECLKKEFKKKDSI